jgi:uncharacterized repeat protein (TIGR01451 family)
MLSRGALGLASPRVRRGLALSWSALFILSLLLQYMAFAMAPAALAVHDEGLFELDGNAVSEGGVAGEDWDHVFAGTDAADSTVFLTDKVNSLTDDIFTGGSSKDINDTSAWLWTKSKPQAKNDITHAFAAAYTATSAESAGDTIVYFGLNKYDASGDNFVGFWFLQGQVGPTGTGIASGSPFSGSHTPGDVLVLADYTNGGGVSEFSVYKWVASGGDVTTHLDTVASGVPCTSAGVTDLACAATNLTTATSPWPFTDKSGESNFLAGELFEGGINLTDLGLDKGCFTSFIAETRSSQSVTATLSDFAGGQFSFCSAPDIATQVKHGGTSTGDNGHITIGQSVTDTATVTGSKGTATGTIEFFVCGPSGSAPDCSTGGTKVGVTKTLSSGSATSDAFTPSAVGSYCFRAEYTPATGSKYLAASHTNTTSECFVVDKKPTAITTSAEQSVSVGNAISDSANLTGATADAGGTITFSAYGPSASPDCSGTAVYTTTVSVSGPGTYGPASFTPATAGTYYWIASYSGDAKNLGSTGTCGDEGENDTVNKVTPQISTDASADVEIGGSISDTATVSGGHSPSGTVTFSLYGPDDANCDGAVIFTSTVALSGGSATSGSFTPSAVGTYRWTATYNGDANNNSVSEGCNGENENVDVTKASPSITTSLVSGEQSGTTIDIALGDSAHDTSALHDATADAGGTVHYQVFLDASCQTLYTDAGTKAVVNGVPGDSNSVQFILAGNYYWSADYSGDAKNESASSSCDLEVVSVGLNHPTISTNASGSVVVGGDIHDTATLADGFEPTGSITFQLFGPDDASCDSAIFTSIVAVDGNGDYNSDPFTTSEPGTYRWIATYSGDANNAAVSGECGDLNEDVLVTIPNIHAVKLVATNDGEFGPTSVANPGDTLTFQITVSNSGNGAATNVPVSDDLTPVLAHATYNGDCSNACSQVGNVLHWTIPSIAPGDSVVLTYSVTLSATFPTGTTHLPNVVVVTGPGSNCEQGSTDEDCDTDTTVATSVLTIDKAIFAADGSDLLHVGGLAQATVGDTLLYTLTYHGAGTLTKAVISDPVPAELQYVDGSAVGDANFTFAGYDPATRTLTWTAATLPDPATGTVSFKVVALEAAAHAPNATVTNVATIESDQTPIDDGSVPVQVAPKPEELTPPPTDTIVPATGTSNPGFALMLILIGVAAVTLGIGFVMPVPARARRRDR